MRRLASTARATTATAFSKTLRHATFAKSLRVTDCYPKSHSIHLH